MEGVNDIETDHELFELNRAIRVNDVGIVCRLLSTPRIRAIIEAINTGSTGVQSPLFWAVRFGRADCVVMLLDDGLNQHLYDDHGFTAVHHAARRWETVILHTLLQRGARVDALTRGGLTPLMLTIMFLDYPENAALLLSYGANPDLTDRDGHNVYWQAQNAPNVHKSDGYSVHAVLREHRERRMAVVDASGTVLPVELAELCGDYVLVTAVRKAIDDRTRKADHRTVIDLVD